MNIEGNKGADYLKIEPRGENKVFLEIGHCCVVYFEGVVPVEVLTSILGESLGNKKTADWEIGWTGEYRNELLSQVERKI